MAMWKDCIRGVASVLSLSASPLYRYPYRNASEAFTGDWQRIAQDINNALDNGHESERQSQ